MSPHHVVATPLKGGLKRLSEAASGRWLHYFRGHTALLSCVHSVWAFPLCSNGQGASLESLMPPLVPSQGSPLPRVRNRFRLLIAPLEVAFPAGCDQSAVIAAAARKWQHMVSGCGFWVRPRLVGERVAAPVAHVGRREDAPPVALVLPVGRSAQRLLPSGFFETLRPIPHPAYVASCGSPWSCNQPSTPPCWRLAPGGRGPVTHPHKLRGPGHARS